MYELQLPSDGFNGDKAEWDRFYDVVKDGTGLFLLLKYIVGLAPSLIFFVTVMLNNYVANQYLLTGLRYVNFLYVLGVNYGLALPSDIFLAVASKLVSAGDIQRYNVMYRFLTIGIMIWNIAISVISIIGLSQIIVTTTNYYEMITSVVATIFSLTATSCFGMYVEWKMQV